MGSSFSVVLASFLDGCNHPSTALTVEVNRDIVCLLYASLLPYGNRTQPLCSEWLHPKVAALILELLILEVLLVANAVYDSIIAIHLHVLGLKGHSHI